MVCEDEFPHYRRKVVGVGHRQAVGDVADDVAGAFGRSQAGVVARAQGFVFDEALGVLHLAYVVVHRTCANQQDIGSDAAGGGIGHIHHLEGMLEGAGRLLGKLHQQGVIGVGQLQEPGIGHQHKHPLEQVDQRITGHGEHRAQEKEPDLAKVGDLAEVVDEVESDEGHRQGGEGYHRSDELLPATVEIVEDIHRDDAGNQVHQEQFGAVVGEYQKRQQRHHIDRQDHLLAEERKQEKGRQGEGGHIQHPRIHPLHDEGDYGREGNDEEDICEAVELLEYQRVRVVYRKEEDKH